MICIKLGASVNRTSRAHVNSPLVIKTCWQSKIYQAIKLVSTCNKSDVGACKLSCCFYKGNQVNETLTSSVFYCVQVVQAQKCKQHFDLILVP
jgi:hypothetical protein